MMPYSDKGWEEKFEVKKSSIKKAGKGVFTKVKIKKGEHIGFYTGKILTAKQIEKEPYISSSYIMEVTKNYYILAEGKKANFTRFINHSNKPNAEIIISKKKKTARIAAIKKIKKGEEIFYDYSDEYWENIGFDPK